MPQAPAMMAGGKGVVVNISSMQAFFGLENQVAYGASKAALNQATRVMAVELGPSTVALPHRRVKRFSPPMPMSPPRHIIVDDPS